MPYLPPTSHITLLATVRRERLLPVSGNVMVRAGQRVEASDVIAQGQLPESHRLVDVARLLGTSRSGAAALMTKQEGEEVKKGEAIAKRKGLFGDKPVPSPVDGKLVLMEEGRALLAALTPVEVRAGLPGQVVSTVPERGAIIETTGALLEGIWGNGCDDLSVLRVLSDRPSGPLNASQLDLALRGAVVAAGYVDEDSLFRSLQDIGVRGLILGSATAAQLLMLQSLPFPVLITDAFGGQGFSEPAYNLLAGNSGREAWVNAHPANRFTGARPEVIIPLPTPSAPPPLPPEGEPLIPGKRVRVLRGPEAGRVGTVTSLSDRAVFLPNGIRTLVASISLDDTKATQTTVTAPFANLELLE